ncbi:MAG: transporter substrate-binding domain-containing protein [Treponema sp.]|nr:transporter substrate-binding domain-containing protein [Treponema sp.]
MKYNKSIYHWLTCVGVILILMCIPQWLYAQTKVKAGVFLGMPFVTENPAELPWAFVEEVDGKGIPFHGMAIDLWMVLQNRMNLQTEYYRYTNLNQLIQDLEDEKIDVILTNLTVNYERAQRIKFTFPWYEGGLRIAVNTNVQKSHSITWGRYIFFALLFLAVMSGLSIPLMFVRKKIEPEFPKHILEGFSITFKDLISALKSGKLPINVSALKIRWIWNIIIALWGLVGVGFIAYITSTITTIMTASVLSQTAIESLHDLGNSRIGVVKGSIGEMILDAGGYNLVHIDTVPGGWNAVGKQEIDAFVYDAPVLEYADNMFPNRNIRLLDGLFHRERYAFATHDIDFADRLSTELIKLYEDGTLDKLRFIYVGQ